MVLAFLGFGVSDSAGDRPTDNQLLPYLSDTLTIDDASVRKNEKVGLFMVFAVAVLLGIGIVVVLTRAAMGS